MPYRIDNETAAIELPAAEPIGVNPNGFFREAIVEEGIEATIISASWLNGIQETLCHPIETSGLTLNKFDNSQLTQAIQHYVSQGLAGIRDSIYRTITQTGHGFVAGDLVYFNGTSWAKGRANALSSSWVFMVKAVNSANSFDLLLSGFVSGLANISLGVNYLSPTLAGKLTTVAPATTGQVSKACFIATTSTSGYFVNFEPIVVGSGGGGSGEAVNGVPITPSLVTVTNDLFADASTMVAANGVTITSADHELVITDTDITIDNVSIRAPQGDALVALSDITPATDTMPYFTSSVDADVTPLTSYARTLLDDADANTARSTLGLSIGTNVQGHDAKLDELITVSASAAELDILYGATLTTTELNYLDGVTSSLQSQLDSKAANFALTSAVNTINTSLSGKSDTNHTHTLSDITDVTASSTELNYASGVTSGIQSQLNLKAATTYVDDAITTLDTSVSTALSSKASITYVDAQDAELQSNIDGKAATVHTHALADITDITASSAELNYVDGVTSPIQTQLNTKAATTYVDSTAATLQTNIDGKSAIGHTHTLANVTDVTASVSEVNKLAGLTTTKAELAFVTGVTSNIQTQINTNSTAIATKAATTYVDAADATLQTNIDGKANAVHTHVLADITNVSATAVELNYSSGVTSGIQAQLNGKAATSHTHVLADVTDVSTTATQLNYLNTVSSNVQSQINGKAASSHTHTLSQITDVTATAGEVNMLAGLATTSTELGYVSGVTSAIQAQINTKAATTYVDSQDATKQPLDATLTALAGVTTAADKIIYATGADTFTTADFTATARSLLDDTSTSAMRTTLGVNEGYKINVTGTTATLTNNGIHILTNASQTTVTIPATAAVGDSFKIIGGGGAAFIVQANTGQTINVGVNATSAAGTLTSSYKYDIINIFCITANTTFVAESNNMMTIA